MTTLVLHHSAGNQNRPAIDDWNTGKKWYNWIIDGKGVLHEFKTTPNQRSCGPTFDLAFSGDFTKVNPTSAQIATWNKFRDSHPFGKTTTHGQLAKDRPGCATASACPGRLLQFISLKPTSMPTCEEQLAQANLEIRKLNTEIGRVTNERDAARTERDAEKVSHRNTLDVLKAANNTNNDLSLLKQKIENAKNALA